MQQWKQWTEKLIVMWIINALSIADTNVILWTSHSAEFTGSDLPPYTFLLSFIEVLCYIRNLKSMQNTIRFLLYQTSKIQESCVQFYIFVDPKTIVQQTRVYLFVTVNAISTNITPFPGFKSCLYIFNNISIVFSSTWDVLSVTCLRQLLHTFSNVSILNCLINPSNP